MTTTKPLGKRAQAAAEAAARLTAAGIPATVDRENIYACGVTITPPMRAGGRWVASGRAIGAFRGHTTEASSPEVALECTLMGMAPHAKQYAAEEREKEAKARRHAERAEQQAAECEAVLARLKAIEAAP